MPAGVKSSSFYSSAVFLWLMFAVGASFFLFSIDRDKLFINDGSLFDRVLSSIRIPSLDLGIDLQGGVRLVYSVDIDKAIENRLAEYGKKIDSVLKNHKVKARPVSKVPHGASVLYKFKNADDATAFRNVIIEKVSGITAEANETQVSVKLSFEEDANLRATSVSQTVGVLKSRLDTFSVRGLSVFPHGQSSLVIQLPGMASAEDVKHTITKTARLEFKIVEKLARSKDEILDVYEGFLPADKMIVAGSHDLMGNSDQAPDYWCLVSVFPDLTGDRIEDARLAHGEDNRPGVGFRLNMQGARELRQLSRDNIGRQMAIIIDNRAISVAEISSELGSENRITGRFSPDHIAKLSSLLRSGALIAPLKLEQESTIGSELGDDALKSGLMACAIALSLLFVFGVFYYRWAGVFAFIALLYNLLLTLFMLSLFKATLTLPGIVGMVLGVGMAIDSSVLIFERIKDLLREGVNYKDAVVNGFAGAVSVILESNGATFLTAAILFKFGSPSIQGFAVTLAVGVCSTILAGVFFLRSVLHYIVVSRGSKFLRFD